MGALSTTRVESKPAARLIAITFPALAAPAALLLVGTAFVRGDMDLLRAALVLMLASVTAGAGVGAFVSAFDMTSQTGAQGFLPWLLVLLGPVMFVLELASGYSPSWLRSVALQDAFAATGLVGFNLIVAPVLAATLLTADIRRNESAPVTLRHRAKLFTDRTFFAVAAVVMLSVLVVRETRVFAQLEAKPGRALPVLTREAARYPDHFATQLRYGDALLRIAVCPDAIPPLRRAVALKANHPTARSELAYALLCAHKYEDAIVTYRTAIELDPSNIRARYGLAWTLEQLHDSSASDEYRAILLQRPNDAYALARQATIHFSRGDRSHALVEMRRALVLDTSRVVQRAAADLFVSAQLMDEALPIYRSLAQRDPTDLSALAQYASAAYFTGHLQESTRAFDELAARHPQLMEEVEQWRELRDAARRGVPPAKFSIAPVFRHDTVLFNVR